MGKKRYKVKAECPQCACGDVTFMGPDELKERYIGPEEEMEVLCPICGTKHKGKVEVHEGE